jgi:hypothetical protein
MFKTTNYLKAFALLMLFLGYQGLNAQESLQLPHGIVKIMASDIEAGTSVAPPPGFMPGEDRAVTINVTYTGFTPEAQTAFQYAVDIWASLLTSGQTIEIDAQFTALGAGILGSAGPDMVHKDFAGAPLAGTWYPSALADKLNGADLNPGSPDIGANFSNTFGFYFGTDGNPGVGEYDFVSVVLHEIGHGLGFLSLTGVNLGLGYNEFMGFPFVYDSFVENGAGAGILSFTNGTFNLALVLTSNDLFFDGPSAVAANFGPRPPIYAPSSWNAGSSISHLNEVAYPAGDPNSLMTPAIGPEEAIHSPGVVALGILEDIGWDLDIGCQLWYLPIDYTASISEPAVFACSAPPGYELAIDQFCVQDIVNNDPYCETVDWDGLCQSAFCNCADLNGCIDGASCNYDPAALCDDGSCTFPGCTDPVANNYDPIAGCDDGSCCDAYTWYTLVVGGGSFPSEISWTVSNEDGELASGGAPSTTFLCYGTQSCLTILEYDSFGDGWNGGTWTLLDDADNVVSSGTLEGGSSGSDPMIGACSSGCTNLFACNYNVAANVDDGSCTFPGCTNSNACNYSGTAGCDDGSCVYNDDDCSGACVAFNGSNTGLGFTSVYDPMGWTFTLIGNANVNMNPSSLILKGTNNFVAVDGDGSTVFGDSESTITAQTTGNFSFDWSADFSQDGAFYEIAYYINGVRIDLSDINGTPNQAGSVSFSATEGDIIGFGIESVDGCCGEGYAHFYNYTYPLPTCGCTDPGACNYDASADFDNGCCDYQFGCMDYMAVNYNPTSLCDDGNCVYEDACGNMIDGGGSFVGFNGDYSSSNWAIETNTGNGTVSIGNTPMTVVGSDGVFPFAGGGEIDTRASLILTQGGTISFNWDFNTTDGAQFDPAYYINNVPVQLTDDTGPQSQDGSISFAANAGDLIGFGVNSVDGCCGAATLVITSFSAPADPCLPGCNEAMACNYDPAATSNDGSCEYLTCAGCTYSAAPEYDPLATFDDGTCTCPSAGACPGDLNGDGFPIVNTSDLLAFLSYFGTPCP